MNVVGKVGSLITQGVYSVATPFHPFGGAVDIIVVQQQDGSYKSTPWYVRFGKFQGVLKGAEKVVRIEVNGVEANFHMYIDNSGEAYFVREFVPEKNGGLNGGLQKSDSNNGKEEDRDDNLDTDTNGKDDTLSRLESYDLSTGEFQLRDEHVALGVDRLERTESDGERPFYDFPDCQSSLGSSAELSEYGSGRYDNLDTDHVIESEDLSSEVVLVSVDGHILTAPISSSEKNSEDVELDTPQFLLGPGEGTEESINGKTSRAIDYLGNFDTSVNRINVPDAVKMADNDESQLEVHQHDGGFRSEVDGIPDSEKQLTEGHLSCNLENTSPVTNREGVSLDDRSPRRMKKEDVFKSCLELPELTAEVGNVCSHDASPKRIFDVAEQSPERSPLRSASADGTQDPQSAFTAISDELSSCTSGIPTIVDSPESAVQAETLHRNLLAVGASGSDSMIDDFNYANGKVEEEVETAPSPQEPASEEEAVANDDIECPTTIFCEGNGSDTRRELEISLCRNLLHSGMGSAAAKEAFSRHRISEEEFKSSAASIVKNENLVVRIQGNYLPWDKAAPIILGMVAYGLELSVSSNDAIPVEQDAAVKTGEDESGITSIPSGRGWSLWPIPFRRGKSIDHTSSNASNEEVLTDSESGTQNRPVEATSPGGARGSPCKQLMRTNVPTSEQIASLNLKEGQNMVTFISFSRVLGAQKVEAHIYLWKWNARIVISDVDGTITKSDVLGQVMPLVGKDWTHSGIARLFSAIKGNGYQLLFLSARAIVQAYLTKTFLFNLKQDGKTLPNGPVVISPDGLFPSLYREVIRRAPHEFKIACLEDIKSLFPPEHNPFYAGFGNRDTDELSYRKIGIPKGKIFIINPKGEVAINNRIDVKSYTSLHTLVHDMFPPTSLAEQEDYNSWNYWRMPLPDIDG